MQWDDSVENLLSTLADEAQISSVPHHNCHLYYKKWSLCIQIPVIALSTITGGGNFISSADFLSPFKEKLIFIMGAISLFIAVISAVYKYLNLDSIVEGHRLSSLNWNKLYNDIRNQLLITSTDRQNANDFYKLVQSDYDRLLEVSPVVPQSFVAHIRKKLENTNVEKPYYLGNFRHIHINRQKTRTLSDDSVEPTENHEENNEPVTHPSDEVPVNISADT